MEALGGPTQVLSVLKRIALEEFSGEASGSTGATQRARYTSILASFTSLENLYTSVCSSSGAQAGAASVASASAQRSSSKAASVQTAAADAARAVPTPKGSVTRRPLDTFALFFVQALSNVSTMDTASRRSLAQLLIHEAEQQLSIAADSSVATDDGDSRAASANSSQGGLVSWVRSLKQREHVEFGCWLIDLLLTVHQLDEFIAAKDGAGSSSSSSATTTTKAVAEAKEAKPKSSGLMLRRVPSNERDDDDDEDDEDDEASSSSSSSSSSSAKSGGDTGTGVVAAVLFDRKIYDSMTAILNMVKFDKVFKLTRSLQTLLPVLTRLLSQVQQFVPNPAATPVEKRRELLPDLTKLDWLSDKMHQRRKQESKNDKDSPDSAKSRTLQTLVNLVLVVEDSKKLVARMLSDDDVSKADAVSKPRELVIGGTPKQGSDASAATTDGAEEQDHDLNTGPDFDSLTWFEQSQHVARVMTGVDRGKGIPPWFVRAAWLQHQSYERSELRETAHPYTEDVEWSRIHIPNAESLAIRIDSKSTSDSSDYLKFGIVGDESKGTVDEESVRVLASLSGKMVFQGDNPQQLVVQGNTVYVQFKQSWTPVHSGMFCSRCEYPIRGKRFVCGICEGGVNLCESCEQNNADENHHDPTHLFLQVRRPVPAEYSMPRVFPNLNTLYTKKDVSDITQGHVDENPLHADATCAQCGIEGIRGVRYRCAVCENFDLCGSCEQAHGHKHDLSHIFIKIRHPVRSTAALGSRVLKPFVDSFQEETQCHWGWKFTVYPKYPVAHQHDLLRQSQDAISDAIASICTGGKAEIDRSLQVVEMVNRYCAKLAGTKKKAPSQRRRRQYYYRDIPEVEEKRPEIAPLIVSPTEFADTERSLAVYNQLDGLSLSAVHLRFAVLRLLNHRLLGTLPLIDWSSVHDASSLSYVFGRLRGLIFSELKNKLWQSAIERSAGRRRGRGLDITLDNVKAARARDQAGDADQLDVIENTMFGQMFSQLRTCSAAALRINNQQPWNVRYKRESGIDAGGLFRDSLTNICNELQSTHVPLFIPCPNARHGVGITLDKFMTNRSLTGPIYESMYQFVGRLMGVAIRSNNPLSLDLPSMVWKTLVGTPLDEGDLQAVDELCVKAMKALLDEKDLKSKGITPENFYDVYGFTFTYSASDETVVELKEGGADIPVTWELREEYARLVHDLRLRECMPQARAIRQGLVQVIPARFLSLLTWKELELEVCGSPEVDIELLKQHTDYSGCSASDPHIKIFWKVLESFSQLERAQFLRFVWGRSRLPQPSKFKERMRIDSTNIPADHLPHAHTCFFSLELPQYPNEQVMRDKLLKAITMCTSMENA